MDWVDRWSRAACPRRLAHARLGLVRILHQEPQSLSDPLFNVEVGAIPTMENAAIAAVQLAEFACHSSMQKPVRSDPEGLVGLAKASHLVTCSGQAGPDPCAAAGRYCGRRAISSDERTA
jgi:hypothetical protein